MSRLAAALFLVLLAACSNPTPKQPAVAEVPAPAKELTAAEVLGVKRDFTPRYELINMDRPDFAGVPRLVVRVRVPRGLSREELEQNVRHALLHFYASGPVKFGAISVGAYASERMSMGADAALGEFAPHGQWSAANPAVPLSDWQAKISFEESYFEQRTYFAKGTRAVLVLVDAEFSDTISLSRKANQWLEEDIIAELKPGAPVVVIGHEDFGRAGVRYEVETVKPRRRGWVHSFDLKAE